MALTDNLISYWKLDEASGNAVDSVGSNTLTDNNTVTSGAGKINTSRQFTAANTESFSIPDNAALSTGDIDFTFSAWVWADSLGAFRTILDKDVGGVWEYQLQYSLTHNAFNFYLESAGGSIETWWSASPSLATWYLVVAWHDSVANTSNIQVNNGTPVSNAYTFGVRDGAGDFSIGKSSGGEYWDGQIDECGFWKRALTDAERTRLYNGGAGLAFASFISSRILKPNVMRPRPFKPGLAR